MIETARIDFNADLGEGFDDAALLPYLSSASVACGMHAGNASLMRDTVELCLARGVAIGAHPSFDDRENFGRRELSITPEDAYALVLYQIGALAAIARAAGGRISHVKPHGALYNMAARDAVLAGAIARAVRDFDFSLWLIGLSGSALTAAGERLGLRVAHEVFAERRYEADGKLTPRSHANAVIEMPDESATQVRSMLRDGIVVARTGERVPVRADTLCLHGDRLDAVEFARSLHATLAAQGVRIQAMGDRG